MRFVEEAIARAGLSGILESRRGARPVAPGDWEARLANVDVLVLGALADLVREEEAGPNVFVHVRGLAEEARANDDVTWIVDRDEALLLRRVAVARVMGARGARIGIDAAASGIEIAQVALGFGASDLRWSVARKSGLPILGDETRKVKGAGRVSLSEIKKREIAALVTHAGRVAVFVGEGARREDGRREQGGAEVSGA